MREWTKNLQPLLFGTTNSLKFQITLIYTTEGFSVDGHVIGGTLFHRVGSVNVDAASDVDPVNISTV
jgi:hypothetical protein